MDGLSNDERILAWLAVWHPSFSGIAIVNADYTFRAVNQQFCRITGASPAEFIGNTFTEITPIEIRDLEKTNAELVKKRTIESYILPKSYEFVGERKVHVVLLVKGVYCQRSGDFLFFVSRIMEDKKITLSDAPCPKPIRWLEWIDKKKVGMGIVAALSAVGYGIAEYFFKKG